MSSMDETSNDLKILISKTGAFLKTLRTHESYDPSLILQWKEFEVLCVELDYLMLREVKPKEADINDRFKELETKENELMGNMGVSLIDLSSGEKLSLVLSDRETELEQMAAGVHTVLKTSSNPAKLVLDSVSKGFYGMRKGFGSEIEMSIVKKSCVMLLEELMRLKPEISRVLSKRAGVVAKEGKEMMDGKNENDVIEVLGFMMLLSAYGLVDMFDLIEIRKLLEIVAQHKLASELREVLGLVDKIPERLFTEVPIEEAPCSASSTPSCWPELKSLCINMDGKGLVSFLCQHVNDHESMREAISDSLELASDPGKLILDVLPGFLFNKFFQTLQFSDVRKSCILLLEQMKPVFCLKKRDMKTKALKLAADWKARLAHTYAQPVLAYGFLLFIVAYNLVSSFDASDLLAFFVKASQRKQSPKLFLALGLADKTTTLINDLLQNTLMLEAVEYICAYELLHEFPPQCILNGYLKYQKNMQKYKGKNLCGPQNKAIDREIVAIRAVIKCISDHNLESHCPLNKFEKQIVKLEKRKTNTICSTQKEEKETKEKQTSTQKEEKKATENQTNEVIASQVWTVPAPPQEQQVNFVLHVERIPSEVCTETKVTPVPHSTSSNMLYNIPYEVDSVNAPQEETLVKPAPHGTIASLLESICSKFWTVKSAQQETQMKPAPNTDIPSKLCAQEAPQQEAQEKAAPQSVEIHADLERIPSEACTVNAPQQESQVKLVQHNVSSTLLESIHSIISVEESQQKIEVRTAQPNTSSSPSSWLKWYCVSMDGKGLVLFLCQHVEDHDLMREAVSDSLKSAPNSAKLVLDILPSFLYSNKDFDRFLMHTVRVSCILLLEQLYKLLPQVNISMNVDAMKLAVDWKAKVATTRPLL